MNTNIKKLESARSFYEQLKFDKGFTWIENHYIGLDGHPISPILQYDRITKMLLRLRIARAVMFCFALIGYYGLVCLSLNLVTEIWWINIVTQTLLGGILLTILLAPLFFCEKFWNLMEDAFDGWVGQSWTTEGFQSDLWEIHYCANRGNDRLGWLVGEDREVTEGKVPAHVIRRCDEGLISFARNIIITEEKQLKHKSELFMFGELKISLKRQFEACRRFGVTRIDGIESIYRFAKDSSVAD